MTVDKNLAMALLKAQGNMPKLIKDSTNPHFRNTYASLAAVLDTVRGPLTEAGLILYQSASAANGEVIIRSMLIHAESGEYIEDILPIPVAQATAQAMGSAITYGRRYLAIAQCGLAPDDDDGEAGSQQPQAKAKAQSVSRETSKPQVQHRQPPTHTPKAPTSTAENDVDFHQGGKEWDNIPSAAEREKVMMEQAIALPHLDIAQDMFDFVTKCRGLHKTSGDKKLSTVNNNGSGSGQYGLLCSRVDTVCDDKKAHRYVISALAGYEVSKEAPPGWKLKNVIDWLGNEYKDDTEAMLKKVWSAIKSAEEAATSA